MDPGSIAEQMQPPDQCTRHGSHESPAPKEDKSLVSDSSIGPADEKCHATRDTGNKNLGQSRFDTSEVRQARKARECYDRSPSDIRARCPAITSPEYLPTALRTPNSMLPTLAVVTVVGIASHVFYFRHGEYS